jgi:methylmalonyl-CoA mutase N-terminal domain/subunit
MEGEEKRFQTLSGTTIQPVYDPDTLVARRVDFTQHIGAPGKFPFTRGIHPLMYRRDLWVMGQYSGFGSAEDTNMRIKYLLERGQTGFAMALDLPTQMGIDSDNPLAAGEVGKIGVAINTLRDMEILLDGIPWERVRQIRTTANAISAIFISMLIAVAEKQGISPDEFRLLIQNDILKEFIARGTYIFPPEPSVRLTVDVIEYCIEKFPSWNPIQICGYHMREAGCSAAQEMAFAFSDAVTYIEETLRRGVPIDRLAPKLYVMFSCQPDLLEEVAKFRTARRIWAYMMRDRFGTQDPESQKLRIFGFTGGSWLTAQEPLNNTVRVTLEVLAAALGGVQVLASSSYDEALSIPSEEAVRLALRTQQIIAHESGVAFTVDPLGGSYFLESLGMQMETEAKGMMKRIDDIGGAIRAIEKGYIQKEIAEASHRTQKAVEEKRRGVVGVNLFAEEKGARIQTMKVASDSQQRITERLQEVKNQRDKHRVQKALQEVEETARGKSNLIPAILNAVKAYATIGEISGSLKKVFSEFEEVLVY